MEDVNVTNVDNPTIEPVTAPAESQAPAALDTMLQSITAPDGRQKYSSVEAALQSIPHAQAKIIELQQNIESLQAELAQRKGVEQMLDALQQPAEPVIPQQPVAQLDPADIDSRIEQLLKQREQQAVAQQNLQTVEQTLTAQFGDKAKEVFASKAAELGVSVEYLMQQASQAPKLVLGQFAVAPQAPQAQPVRSTVMPPSGPTVNPAIKPVMYGASTKDTVASYRAHAKQ